jgi:putative hydrolase of the HAD superfamily
VGRITSIIFDLDGTLYRSRELADEIHRVAVAGLALQLGVATDDADRRLAAAKADLAARHGTETTLSAACAALGCDIRRLHAHLAEQVAPEGFLARDERVVAMLQRLQESYELYIYTNNDRELTTRIMRQLGLEDTFAGIFTVEDFWRPKPDRLALAKMLAAIGAEAVECLFVGDRYDVDLRLPEEHGSAVYLTDSVERLLELERFCSAL